MSTSMYTQSALHAAYTAGGIAKQNNLDFSDNPYQNPEYREMWFQGYQDASVDESTEYKELLDEMGNPDEMMGDV